MTNEEAKAYFEKCNEDIIAASKDENVYDYEKQEIMDVFMRTTYEANAWAISALSAPSANVISIDQANAMIKSYVSHYEENKGEWIPVSERLPYNHEYIKNNGLFNVSDGNRSYSEWFDIYDTQRFGEPTMSGFRVDYAVTAWQPLPEPYKKGE